MPSAGFEPATPATKRPQTYALDRAATDVGYLLLLMTNIWIDPGGLVVSVLAQHSRVPGSIATVATKDTKS
jgi:hypothetical protein